MAKYKKRADGRYFTQVSTGKYDEDGKPIRIPVYGTSSRDLERKVGEIKTDLKRGIYADDRGMFFGEYAKVWYEAKKGTVKAGTAKDYLNIVKNHFGKINNIRLKDLTKTDIQAQINSEVSEEIRRRIVITVKQILESAIDDGLVYKNVARTIKQTIPKRKEKDILSDLEKRAIKKCEFTDMEKMFVDILFGCGLRRGEALALTPKSIDFNRGGISVTRAISYQEPGLIKEPKTNASIRFVPAPQWLLNELRTYLDSLNCLYLFHGSEGQIMPQATYKRFWKGIRKKINEALGGNDNISLTSITPHTFRHNYATLLYYSGVDVKEAQRLLGHSTIRITLDIYTHLMNNEAAVKEKINCIAL